MKRIYLLLITILPISIIYAQNPGDLEIDGNLFVNGYINSPNGTGQNKLLTNNLIFSKHIILPEHPDDVWDKETKSLKTIQEPSNNLIAEKNLDSWADGDFSLGLWADRGSNLNNGFNINKVFWKTRTDPMDSDVIIPGWSVWSQEIDLETIFSIRRTNELWFNDKNGNRIFHINGSNPNNLYSTLDTKFILKVDSANSDVLSPNYNLLSIPDLINYISANQKLPSVPSANDLNNNGIDVSSFNMLMLNKIEELTQYIIELHEEIQILKNNNNND